MSKRTEEQECIFAMAMLMDLAERNFRAKEHSPWCNGVHADNGACEGDYYANNVLESAHRLFSAKGQP